MQAVVEIPFAGFWNMQGRILHSPWLNDDGFRWSTSKFGRGQVTMETWAMARSASRSAG